MLSSRSSETAAGRYFIRVYPPHRAGSRFEYPPVSHAAGKTALHSRLHVQEGILGCTPHTEPAAASSTPLKATQPVG